MEKLNEIYAACGIDNKLLEFKTKFFKAHKADKVVGVLRLVTDDYKVAFIADIAILPEYQGQGAGKILLDSVINYTKEKGFEENEGELMVFSRQASMIFYLRNNFRVDGKGMYYHYDWYKY